ncbi:MAG: rhombosortase [Gammaproteobacteria bacterium]|nr:rhombosortase [Gammaproteobacteria bacterium]
MNHSKPVINPEPIPLLPRDRQAWVMLLLMLLVAIAIAAGGELWRLELRYERDAIMDGEWWRLISGHWTHLGLSHLLLNLSGLIPLWLLFVNEFRWPTWMWVIICGVIAQAIGFMIFEPQLRWYVGLSGLLHSIFAAGVWAWCRQKYWLGYIAAVVLLGKLLWEQIAGPLPSSAETAGGPVVVDAHWYGAIGGVIAMMVWDFARKIKDRKKEK